MSSLIKKLTTKKKKIAFTTGHGEPDRTRASRPQGHARAGVRGHHRQPLAGRDRQGRRRADRGRPQAGLRREGPAGDRQVPHGGQGRRLPGRRHGHAGAARRHGPRCRPAELKMGQPNDSGLGKLLEAYGFKVNQDFVFDPQNAPGPIDINGRPMLANLPFFVAAETAQGQGPDGARRHPRGGVPLRLQRRAGRARSRAASRPRASSGSWPTSSKDSWKHTGFFVLGAGDQDRSRQGPQRSYASATPTRARSRAPSRRPAPRRSPTPTRRPAESKKPVRLVVVGDSDFANDEYVQLGPLSCSFYGAGAQLLVNAIGWTVEDEALTPLRSKTSSPAPSRWRPRRRGRDPVGQHPGPAPGFLCVRRRALAPPPRRPLRPEALDLPTTSSPRRTMNRKTLLAGGVFAGLLIITMFVLRAPEKGARTGEAPRPVADHRPRALDTLEVTKDGKKMVIKKEGGKYKVVEPIAYAAEEDAAKQAFEALEKLEFGTIISDQKSQPRRVRGGRQEPSGGRQEGRQGPGRPAHRQGLARPHHGAGGGQERGLADGRLAQVALRPGRLRLARQVHHHLQQRRRRDAGGGQPGRRQDRRSPAPPKGDGGADDPWKVAESTVKVEPFDPQVANEMLTALYAFKANDFADGGPPAETGLDTPDADRHRGAQGRQERDRAHRQEEERGGLLREAGARIPRSSWSRSTTSSGSTSARSSSGTRPSATSPSELTQVSVDRADGLLHAGQGPQEERRRRLEARPSRPG